MGGRKGNPEVGRREALQNQSPAETIFPHSTLLLYGTYSIATAKHSPQGKEAMREL